MNAVSIDLVSMTPYHLLNYALSTKAKENGRVGVQFQGVCLFPSWEVRLEPEAIWETTLELSMQKM